MTEETKLKAIQGMAKDAMMLLQRILEYTGATITEDFADIDDDEWEAKELKFFNMKKYGSNEKQRQLRRVLIKAKSMIDVNNGRDWFNIYAADRYDEGCTSSKLEYVDFFFDIETLMPGVLKKINVNEKGNKRYKPYSELLAREANDWFVFNGSLPPINELVYKANLGCDKERFMKSSQVIKTVYKMLREI